MYGKHVRRRLKTFVGLVVNIKYPPGNVASCVRMVLHGIIFHIMEFSAMLLWKPQDLRGGSNKRNEKLV